MPSVQSCVCGVLMGQSGRTNVVEQLVEGLLQQRPSPDDGLVRVVRRQQEAHRHDLDAVVLQRDHAVAVVDRRLAPCPVQPIKRPDR